MGVEDRVMVEYGVVVEDREPSTKMCLSYLTSESERCGVLP